MKAAVDFYAEIHRRYGSPAAFIERLNARLAAHKISQGALAKRTGFHQTHISRWLNGHVVPTMETMVTLDQAVDEMIARAALPPRGQTK
jgi:transcriptional regulator with XRE-family HTH domain